MSKWRENLNDLVERSRAAFERLTQREQLIVGGGAVAAVFIIFLAVALSIASAIDKVEHRVKVKTDQLAQVIELQGTYKIREEERQARLRELGRSNARLVSIVEDTARQAGVEISQLRPEEGEANSEGIAESRLDLKAVNLSADRLQNFLNRLEKAPGLVIMRHLRLNKPYKKDLLELELSVSTYHLKS